MNRPGYHKLGPGIIVEDTRVCFMKYPMSIEETPYTAKAMREEHGHGVEGIGVPLHFTDADLKESEYLMKWEDIPKNFETIFTTRLLYHKP